MNMYKFLENTASQYPDSLFLVREKVTYAKFLELVRARAASLDKAGVKSGDVVGILSHNLPEFPITLFAIWYLGGRVLMLDTNLTPFEYDNMTAATDCHFVCAEESFFYKTKNFTFYDITKKDGKPNPDLEPAAVESVDIATLSFTSGSTGTPKIVPLTHFNLIECAHSLKDMREYINQGYYMYGFLPMYHIFGFAVEILAAVEYGCGVILQPSINPKLLMADFVEFRPQIIPAVPRLFEVIRNRIIDQLKARHLWWFARIVLRYGKTLEKIGLGFLVRKVQDPVRNIFGGRVSLLVAGGAATKPEVETFYERLGMPFIQGYGMTETVGPICISKRTKKRLPFAFGAPTTNNEVDIRNKDADGIGVLWVRGHQVFDGYLNNPEVNAQVFDEHGFFNTGDLVSMDKNGELHFAGRKKQVIVLDSGKNVYPDELEALFMKIPGVKNVAVFEHRLESKTVAYAVFSVEEKMTMEKLAAAVANANKKLASYKWVTHFAMTTDDLPVTSTQKVKHHVVRQNLIDGKYPIQKDK
jgi:long-chain acyl-CoA synthetase